MCLPVGSAANLWYQPKSAGLTAVALGANDQDQLNGLTRETGKINIQAGHMPVVDLLPLSKDDRLGSTDR